jgi:transposase
VSTLDHTLKPEATVVRRLEVMTGPGCRRRFSDDDKARMIEETLAPGAVVSEVARRHGITPQQLFTWRRQARQPVGTTAAPEVPAFVPAVIEAPPPERPARRQERKRALAIVRATGAIEVEIDGATVRVGRGAAARTIAAVIRALKAGA